MDGAHGVDMVAPDDPLSPVPGGDVEPASYGWYGRFGGTSGAAPHVAGAFALLKQARPSASVAELEQALIDAALQDLATGDLPDPDIGWGKLRFFDAIDPALREDNAPPELGLAVVESNAVMIDARGTTDAEGDEVVYVVDLDYDGDPDLGPTSDPLLVLDAPLGEYLAVVYGFDGRGGRDGQVVHGVVTDVPAEFGEGPEPTPDTGADAGSDLADAGNPRPDAGATTPGTSRKRGCGVSGRQPPRASWLLAGMVAVVRRRRRRGITLAR